MKRLVVPAALAGLCGGMAEILWIALYSFMTPLSGVEVARQITFSVFPSAGEIAAAPILGVAIHLALSLALAFVFARAVWIPFSERLDFAGAMATAIGVLASIWAVNFFVILPSLNPTFVTLMPYGATLVSKLLFGIAMAWVLHKGEARATRRPMSHHGRLVEI